MPDGDTNPTPDLSHQTPITTPLQRRASAPLPSGSKLSDGDLSKSSDSSKKNDVAFVVIETDQNKPTSTCLITKQTQRASVPLSSSTSCFVEKASLSPASQKIHQHKSSSVPISTKPPQTPSTKSFFGVVLRPASFSGLPSHRPYASKSTGSTQYMPAATSKTFPAMSVEQDNLASKGMPQKIETSTNIDEQNVISAIDKIENNSTLYDGDENRGKSVLNKDCKEAIQKQHQHLQGCHLSQEQQSEFKKVHDDQVRSQEQEKTLTHSAAEYTQATTHLRESNKHNQDRTFTNQKNKTSKAEITGIDQHDQIETNSSVKEINERRLGLISTDESKGHEPGDIARNKSKEEKQAYTPTNENRKSNETEVTTNEIDKQKHAIIPASESKTESNKNITTIVNGRLSKAEISNIQNNELNKARTVTKEINPQKPGGHLKRDVSLPYDQSVLKKRGSLPLKSEVPSFMQAKQMFAVGSNANSPSLHRKSSASDIQNIRVNVRDLVRRMSDTSPGTDRRYMLTTDPACQQLKQSRVTAEMQSTQIKSEFPSGKTVTKTSKATENCPKWREGIQLPTKVYSNGEPLNAATKSTAKRNGFHNGDSFSQNDNGSEIYSQSRLEGPSLNCDSSKTSKDDQSGTSRKTFVEDKGQPKTAKEENATNDLLSNFIRSSNGESEEISEPTDTLSTTVEVQKDISRNVAHQLFGSESGEVLHQNQTSFEDKSNGVNAGKETESVLSKLKETPPNTETESNDQLKSTSSNHRVTPASTKFTKTSEKSNSDHQNGFSAKAYVQRTQNLQDSPDEQGDPALQKLSSHEQPIPEQSEVLGPNHRNAINLATDGSQTTEPRGLPEKKSIVANLISKFSAGSKGSDAQQCPQTGEKSKRLHNHHHRLSLPTMSLNHGESETSQRSKVALGRSNSLRGPVSELEGQGHDHGGMYMDRAEIERLLLKSQELRRSKQQLNRPVAPEIVRQETSKATANAQETLDVPVSSEISSKHTVQAKEPSTLKSNSGRPRIWKSYGRVVNSFHSIVPLHLLDQSCTNTTTPSDAQDQSPKTVPGGGPLDMDSGDQKSRRVHELMHAYSKTQNTRRTTITAVASSGKTLNSQSAKPRNCARVTNDDKEDLLLAAVTATAAKPPPAPTLRKNKPYKNTTTAKQSMPNLTHKKCNENECQCSNEKDEHLKDNSVLDKGKEQHKSTGDTNSNGFKNDDQASIGVESNPEKYKDSISNRFDGASKIQGPEKGSHKQQTKGLHTLAFSQAARSELIQEPETPDNEDNDDVDDDDDVDADDDVDDNDNVFRDESFTNCVSGTGNGQNKTPSQLRLLVEPLNRPGKDAGFTMNKIQEAGTCSPDDDTQATDATSVGLHFPKNNSRLTSQAERIARYKEDRRRQLAYVSEKVGLALKAAPGLDTSPKTAFSQQRSRSMSSSASSTDSKNYNWTRTSDSDQSYTASREITSVSSHSEIDVDPRGVSSENLGTDQQETNAKHIKSFEVNVSHNSPKSQKSTPLKHDCVFRRLTSNSKKSPRCKRNEPETAHGERNKSMVNPVARYDGQHKNSTQVNATATSSVIRSSLAAAKKSEQAGPSVTVGLGPREVCAINCNIPNFNTERRTPKVQPKLSTVTPINSPIGNKEPETISARYAFGSRVPSPRSSPRELKTNLYKNQSTESVVKKTKKSPRDSTQTLTADPNGFPPRHIQTRNSNINPDTLRLDDVGSACQGDVGHGRRKSTATSTLKPSCAETESSQYQSAVSESTANKKVSNLFIPKRQSKTHTASVFSKGFAAGVKNKRGEKYQAQVKTNEDQISLTRQHLSKSRPPSCELGTKSNCDENARQKNSLPDKDLHGPSENAMGTRVKQKFASEVGASQNLDPRKKSRLHEKHNTSSIVPKFDIHNRRKSLPQWNPTTKTDRDNSMSRISHSLAKRASLGSESRISSPASRAERLQNLRREQNKTLSQFKKFIRRDEYSGETAEVTQTTEEHVAHVQECCIRVDSVEEAEALAKALMESVRQGKNPALYIQQLSSTYPSEEVVEEPAHQSQDSVSEKRNMNYFDPSIPNLETPSDIFYDAEENSACPNNFEKQSQKISSCSKELGKSSKGMSQLASKAITKLSSSAKFALSKFQTKACTSERKQVLNLKERGSNEEAQTFIKQSIGTTQSNVGKYPVKQHQSNDEICSSLNSSSTDITGFRTAESLLSCTDLSSIAKDEKGCHVVQALSPRAVEPVMILPHQEKKSRAEQISSSDISYVEVSAETESSHRLSVTDMTQHSKESNHGAFKITETFNALGGKIASFLAQEHHNLLNATCLNTVIDNESASNSTDLVPPYVQCMAGKVNGTVVNPKEPVSVSQTTVTESSTLTISSKTTVVSGPYPASTTEGSVTTECLNAGETQCVTKGTLTKRDSQDKLCCGDVSFHNTRQKANKPLDKDTNLAQREACKFFPSVHGSQGMLNVVDSGLPPAFDSETSETQSSEYYSVPLDSGSASTHFASVSNFPRDTKLDKNPDTTCVSPLEDQIRSAEHKGIVESREHTEPSIIILPHPSLVATRLEFSKTGKAIIVKKNELNQEGEESIRLRNTKTYLNFVREFKDAYIVTENPPPLSDHTELIDEPSKVVASKQIPGKTISEGYKKNEENSSGGTHSQVCVSAESGSETVSPAGQAITRVSGHSSDINDQLLEQNPPSNESQGFRSGTFIKGESDSEKLSGKDSHLCSKSFREVTLENKSTDGLRTQEMPSQTQDSFDSKMKHTASQTVSYTYKDVGTDSLHQPEKNGKRNVSPEKPTSPRSQACAQSTETEALRDRAAASDSLGASRIEGQLPKNTTESTKAKSGKHSLASDKPQFRGATFVVQGQSEDNHNSDSSKSSTHSNPWTHRNLQSGSTNTGDVQVHTSSSSPKHSSRAYEAKRSFNRTDGRVSQNKHITGKTTKSQTVTTTSQATSKDPTSLESSPIDQRLDVVLFEDKNVQSEESCQVSKKISEESQVSPHLLPSPKRALSQLDLDYLIKNLDLSSDGFDSLYLQNAMYLKGAAAAAATTTKSTCRFTSGSKSVPHNTPLTLRRRRSPSSTGSSQLSVKGQTPRNRRRSPLVLSSTERAVCGVEESTPSPRAAWR